MSGSFNLFMGAAALSGLGLAVYVNGGERRAAAASRAAYYNKPQNNNINLKIQK